VLSGLEKAQVVLSMLGENSSKILERLSEKSRRKITAILGETAETDSQTRNMILHELLNKIDTTKSSQSFNMQSIKPSGPPPSITPSPSPVFTDSNGLVSPDNPFGQSSVGSLNDNPFATESTPVAEIPEVKSTLRFNPEDASRICNRLQKEKPQLITFFMTQLNEEEKQRLSEYLPESIMTQAEESKLDKIPLASKVFTNLLKKLAEEEVQEQNNTTTKEDMSFGSDDDFKF